MSDNADPVQVKQIDDVTVVRLNVPRIWTDESTDAAFDKLYSLVDESGSRKLVLDLSAIEYFASAALGKLVALNRKARAADARMVLCHLTPTVQRILQLTRLNDLLVSYDNEDEARQSFK